MGKKESDSEKRHNQKKGEVVQDQRRNEAQRGIIVPFPKKRLWNAEKIRKLCEKIFF
jgi:hypothetical protein